MALITMNSGRLFKWHRIQESSERVILLETASMKQILIRGLTKGIRDRMLEPLMNNKDRITQSLRENAKHTFIQRVILRGLGLS